MSPLLDIKKLISDELPKVKKKAAFLYSLSRSLSYATEQWALPWVEFAVNRTRTPYRTKDKEKVALSYTKLYELLRQDSENMALGLYPYSVLKFENPYSHVRSLVHVLTDAVKITKRRDQNKAHDFDEKKDTDFESAPDYSKRNFHFQTNGYFSNESAELYDHQVEILFGGSSHAMRRLILPLLKKEISGSGEGLHFLEVGCGTGLLTRFMKLAYPKAKITASDMSSSYLKKAQKDLTDLPGINFIQTHAENLPFKDQTFDLVYSCYLFHELPLTARHAVINETKRVLKDSGYWGFVDSLQNNDDLDLQWAIDAFPTNFHEPFYKNYIQNPVESLLEERQLELRGRTIGFFSKALLAKRSIQS